MKKSDVTQWLKDNEYSFPEMTDEEKMNMRKTLNICGAATSSSEYKFPCSFPPMRNGRCKVHGGKTPGGAESPNAKHLRYSKYMPAEILKKVQEITNDPDILSMEAEIQLLTVRLQTLLEMVEKGGGLSGWVDLNHSWHSYVEAQKQHDENAAADFARRIREIIQRGLNDSMVWNDIQIVIENRRRLVVSESKRRVDMQQMIPYEQAMALVLILADIVRSHLGAYMVKEKVVDSKLMTAIAIDIKNLIAIPAHED